MATTSFNKDFTLDSKKSVNSFLKILDKPTESIKINKKLVSPEKEKRGVEELKRILSL